MRLSRERNRVVAIFTYGPDERHVHTVSVYDYVQAEALQAGVEASITGARSIEEAQSILSRHGTPWYVSTTDNHMYYDRFHFRYGTDNHMYEDRHEGEPPLPMLRLYTRTGTWTAVTPYSYRQNPPLQAYPIFDEATARRLAAAINQYAAFFIAPAGNTETPAESLRREQTRRRYGTQVLLAIIPAHVIGELNVMDLPGSVRGRNFMVKLYGFPESGSDMLEVRTDNDEHLSFVSGSELSTGWNQSWSSSTYNHDTRETKLVSADRNTGVWASVDDVYAALVKLHGLMAAGMASGMSFPTEVVVEWRSQTPPAALTYYAEYDGRNRKGEPRLKLTYLRGPLIPRRDHQVLYARYEDGFEMLHTHPTQSSKPPLRNWASDGYGYPSISPASREKLMVMLDARYERGLKGLAGAVTMSDNKLLLTDVKVALPTIGMPSASLELGVERFSMWSSEKGSMETKDVLSWAVSFPESQAHKHWYRGTDLLERATPFLAAFANGESMYFGGYFLHLDSAEDAQRLRVWMDQQLEAGNMAGLAGVTDVYVQSGRRFVFQMERDLGCGLYIGKPSKASKLRGPYQLLVKNNGLRIAHGPDPELLADLAVMLTSIPAVCAELERLTTLPYRTAEEQRAAARAWSSFWYDNVPEETREAFVTQLREVRSMAQEED